MSVKFDNAFRRGCRSALTQLRADGLPGVVVLLSADVRSPNKQSMIASCISIGRFSNCNSVRLALGNASGRLPESAISVSGPGAYSSDAISDFVMSASSCIWTSALVHRFVGLLCTDNVDWMGILVKELTEIGRGGGRAVIMTGNVVVDDDDVWAIQSNRAFAYSLPLYRG
jgi:hypothetical protein